MRKNQTKLSAEN